MFYDAKRKILNGNNMIIESLFKFIIPKSIEKDVIQFTHAKNLIGACIISIFASPLFALVYYFLGFEYATFIILGLEFFILASALLLKLSGSLVLSNMIFVSTLTIMLLWISY